MTGAIGATGATGAIGATGTTGASGPTPATTAGSAAEAVQRSGAVGTSPVGSARARARSRASALWVRVRPDVFARRPGRGGVVASAAVAGGLLVMGGAFLPWLSFYAGLYPMRGVIGIYGRLLAVGGALGALVGGAGAVSWWIGKGNDSAGRAPGVGRSLARVILVLGCALTGFAGWLVIQLLLTFRQLERNPMVVPRLGPGLFLALVGALVILLPALLTWRRG